ncbi:D-arabinono-1,4-lactone oxidase [Jatrophihabitans sp.]|uniref:D-arabinono-1,4-lactone oxidase n=1 Tax=Jatrophihabitans sp. TaxID=1932789 RepID=UPI0038CD3751
MLVEIERRLAPLGARPHWAKLLCTEPAGLGELYDRYADFGRLPALRDPTRKFANRFIERYVSAASSEQRCVSRCLQPGMAWLHRRNLIPDSLRNRRLVNARRCPRRLPGRVCVLV